MKHTLTAVLMASALFCVSVGAYSAQTLDNIVAVAGDSVILESQLDDAVHQLRGRLDPEQLAQLPPEDIIRSRVLDQLILASIQTERAKHAGMHVSDKELNDEIGRLAQQNGMNTSEFIQQLKTRGISATNMRTRMRQELLIQKLRKSEVLDRIGVSSDDVDRYLESQSYRLQKDRDYHIRHILISVNESASPEAVKEAQERTKQLRERAEKGVSFADLAKANSDGQKASKGGDLGWLSGGYMPTLFSDVVPRLKPGEISPVFRGPSGFHLIQLEGTRSADKEDSDGPVMVKEVKAEQILIEPNEIRSDEAAHDKIKQLRERLVAGDDFAELARTDSDDTKTATQGGDLGWVDPRRFPPDFARQLQQLKAGDLSEPFKTDNGWHLVKVLERRERDKSEEQRRFRARQAIGQEKLEEESAIWIRHLRDEAYVDVRMKGYKGVNPNSGG